MASPSLDTSETNLRRNSVWLLELVASLQTARRQLRPLAAAVPGEYFAFDQRIGQLIAGLIQLSSDKAQSIAMSLGGGKR
jgi:hypothetical protein